MSHRKALTLEEKVALIKDNQNGHGLSVRQLADNYKISKSSAANILRRSEEFSTDYSSNGSLNNVLNKFLFLTPFYKKKQGKSLKQLGYTTETFKASNGWLEKFHNRHAISFRTINGECASVDDSTVEEWTQRLSTILDGFNENDVFNADETGFFYRATPDRSLVLSNEECKGGKKSKERLTVLLCSNLTGTEKLKPVVIGRSQRPRCFKNITTSKLPVTWLSNRTARMTSQAADQISITVLDAIKWIDLSWEKAAENTIRNGFRAAAHIDIGGPQLTAAEFVEVDSCIPTFNEWDDYGHLKSSIQVTQDDNEEEEEDAFVEKPPNLPEALEMMRRLHLFASIEQPQ
ncbi:unnamed protein product [Rotaria magnacalcarata]|uniref:HTH CENPB-type domain-containing protein n=3 Tax=Rotaria magnacalcarata TaxID=392030 RepID=A0A8S2M4P3_9BILA|nr:unnamed protein product [Rotaria magnacalcarata]CAF3963137.1 unnamed protein product [Rotaria magnacalcarata]